MAILEFPKQGKNATTTMHLDGVYNEWDFQAKDLHVTNIDLYSEWKNSPESGLPSPEKKFPETW